MEERPDDSETTPESELPVSGIGFPHVKRRRRRKTRLTYKPPREQPHPWLSQESRLADGTAPYIPTKEEIAEACKKILDAKTEDELRVMGSGLHYVPVLPVDEKQAKFNHAYNPTHMKGGRGANDYTG